MSDNSLTDLLLYYVYMEQELNVIREMLCKEPMFCPYTLFKFVDSLKESPQGYLNSEDLLYFLKIMKFPTNLPTPAYIENYNANSDGHLVYSEFLKAILPTDNQALREKVTQQDPQLDRQLTERIQYLYSKLLEAEIKLTIQAETYKRQSHYDVFISLNENGALYHGQLLRYFQMKHIGATTQEIQLIFNRIDILNDGKIDSNEWKIFTLPRRCLVQTNAYSYLDAKGQKKRHSSESRRNVQDFTMSNLSSMEKSGLSSVKRTSLLGTPSKYRDQKTKLRAEMQYSLLMNDPGSGRKGDYQSTCKKSPGFSISDEVETQKKKLKQNRFVSASQTPVKYFIDLFLMMIDYAKKIERHKIVLFEHQDFSLFQCFKKFDRGQKGFLNSRDLKSLCKEPQAVILKFGKENKIRFSDFIRLVEPYDEQSIQLMQEREASSRKPLVMQSHTELTLKLLFDQIEFLELQLNDAKRYLDSQAIPLKEMFYLLAYNKQNITFQDLSDFFWANKIDVNGKEIELLINRLDVDYDGQVSFRDFTQVFR